MVKIPERGDPTLDAIDRIIAEKGQGRPSSGRIGVSLIGEACARKIWYRINKYPKKPASAFLIKCGNNGDADEILMAERLRLVPGIELHTINNNNEQYSFEDLGGRYVGYADGVIKGILQAPKTWHLWEHKSREQKYFNSLEKLVIKDEKSALKKWEPKYYAQAVVLMDKFGLNRHYLTCTTPGGRYHTSVRTNADPEFAEMLRDKAKKILEVKIPPKKISEKPDFYICRFCDFSDTCHD